MCLKVVTNKFKLSDKKTVLAWKLFGVVYQDMAVTDFRDATVSIKKTNTSNGGIILSLREEPYLNGFHAYATKYAADENLYAQRSDTHTTALPVVLENITAEGKEGCDVMYKVYVARKMRVFKTVKEAKDYMKAKENKQ